MGRDETSPLEELSASDVLIIAQKSCEDVGKVLSMLGEKYPDGNIPKEKKNLLEDLNRYLGRIPNLENLVPGSVELTKQINRYLSIYSGNNHRNQRGLNGVAGNYQSEI